MSDVGEARQEVALRDETGVDAQQLLLAGIEVPAEHPQAHGRLGATLGSHHAGRARAGALAERLRLDQQDTGEASLFEEPGTPGADRPASDDDGIGG